MIQLEEKPTKVILEVPDGKPLVVTRVDVTSDAAWECLLDGGESITLEIPGNKPLILTPADMTCDGAWEWLKNGKEVDEDAFICLANYYRYFILALRMTEGTMCGYGEEGSGKTALAVWLGKYLRDLFGKRVSANFPLLPGFGEYEFIDVASEFQQQMEMINTLAKDAKNLTDDELYEKLKSIKLYNRIVLIDEAHEYVDKAHRTTLTKGLGSLNRLHRHLHNLTVYLSQDREDFDKRHVWNRKTHEVTCEYEPTWGYEETCSYRISRIKGNRRYSRTLHIQPADLKGMYKTDQLRGLSAPAKVKL